MANDLGTFAASAAFVVLTSCADPGGDAASTSSSEGGSEGSSEASSENDTSTTSGSTTTDETSAATLDTTSSESSSGSESGEPTPKAIELLVRGSLDGNVAFFRYGWSDGVVEGPTPLVEPGLFAWSRALQLPERRVVFQSDTRLYLGSLDGDPADLVPLDGPPVDNGALTRAMAVDGQDAVVFTSESTGNAYRVDFPGGVAMDPLVVADDASLLPYPLNGINGAVDPLGRYLLFDRDVGKVNVALAHLDPPNADTPVPLTDLAPPLSARAHSFMPDGSGLFWVTFEETGERWDPARALYFAALDGDTIGPATLVEQLDPSANAVTRCVPHPLGLGVVVFASNDSFGSPHDLSYYGIVDGIVQPPVILMTDVLGLDIPTWSPDGNWLTFAIFEQGASERFVVAFEDGQPLPTTSVTTFDYGNFYSGKVLFSEDSQWMYFEHDYADTRDIERIQLTQDGWQDRQIIVPHTPDASRPDLADLSSNGESLLYLGKDEGVPAVRTIDVSGQVPGASVTMSREPIGPYWEAAFSPDDQFVVYVESTDVFEDDHLMLVDVDAPGDAIEVIADSRDWQFVAPE